MIIRLIVALIGLFIAVGLFIGFVYIAEYMLSMFNKPSIPYRTDDLPESLKKSMAEWYGREYVAPEEPWIPYYIKQYEIDRQKELDNKKDKDKAKVSEHWVEIL